MRSVLEVAFDVAMAFQDVDHLQRVAEVPKEDHVVAIGGASERCNQLGAGEAHCAGEVCELLAFGDEISDEAFGHSEAAAAALDIVGDLYEIDLRRMRKDQARH